MLGAVALFVLRPDFDARAVADDARREVKASDAIGPLACTFVPDRSRVTVSTPEPVTLAWGGDGCVNGRTQYAEDGRGGWSRVLVPDGEATVSILDYRPDTRTYTQTRYFLDDARMTEARRLRQGVAIKSCTSDPATRANLAGQQSAIRAALPAVPNEKLVYSCKPAE